MSTSGSQVVESWISSFCNLVGHEYFAEVSEDFIEDDFNLTGLSSQVPMYKEALEMILDVEPEEDEDSEDADEAADDDDDEDIELLDDSSKPLSYRRADGRRARLSNDVNVVESSAELLYGLIHQRYITSRPGIQQMKEKYDLGHFGSCPRVHCASARVLPVGLSDTPGQETVKLFCPSCLDVYTPPNSRFQTVDGAYFGTTFGCLFLMTFPEEPTGATAPPAATGTSSNTLHPATAADDATGNRSLYLSPTSASSQRSPSVPAPAQPSEINGVPSRNFAPGLGAGRMYDPRIYGFRVAERSKSGPRMRWLRMKPEAVGELDEGRRFRAAQDALEAADEAEEDEGEEIEDEGAGGYLGYERAGYAAEEEEPEGEEGAGMQLDEEEMALREQQQQRERERELQADLSRRKKAPMRRRVRKTDGSFVDEGGTGGATAASARGDANGRGNR